MIVLEYFLVREFGWINGTGIASLCWLLSMVILDDRLERREAKAFAAYKPIVYERWTSEESESFFHPLRGLRRAAARAWRACLAVERFLRLGLRGHRT